MTRCGAPITPLSILGVLILAVLFFVVALPVFLAALAVFTAFAAYFAWKIRGAVKKMEEEMELYRDKEESVDVEVIDITCRPGLKEGKRD